MYFYVSFKVGTAPDIRAIVYYKTTSSIVKTSTILASSITITYYASVDLNVDFSRGHVIETRIDIIGIGNSTNGYSIGKATSSQIANSSLYSTTNLWGSETEELSSDFND